jgi:hypothetical protein
MAVKYQILGLVLGLLLNFVLGLVMILNNLNILQLINIYFAKSWISTEVQMNWII